MPPRKNLYQNRFTSNATAEQPHIQEQGQESAQQAEPLKQMQNVSQYQQQLNQQDNSQYRQQQLHQNQMPQQQNIQQQAPQQMQTQYNTQQSQQQQFQQQQSSYGKGGRVVQQQQQVQQQVQGKGIDSDQIPRPLLTLEDSINEKKFYTGTKVGIPPQAHQNFICLDEGSASPRHIRASTLSINQDPAISNETHIPLGVVIQPLADTHTEEEVSIIQYSTGPFRCSRCKAYVNPFFQYVDSGNTAICNLCQMYNPVPPEYYSNTSSLGTNKSGRAETCKGIYEFIAPPEYLNKKIDKNLILLCLELSMNTLANGVFTQALQSLQSILDHIPNPERTHIGIITFDSRIMFYEIPLDLSKELQVRIVGDMTDPCVCLPEQQLFINISNGRERIEFLIDKLQKQAESLADVLQNADQQQKAQYSANSVGSVINTCVHAMAPNSGKILIFSTQLSTQQYGALVRREQRLIGTDKEKTLFHAQNDKYENMGRFSLKNRVGVDLFIFNNDYCDVITTSQVVSLTGGSLYYYPHYNMNVDSEKVHYDLARNLTRYQGLDVIMTLRTSQGLTLYEYYTGAGKLKVRDLELSCIDADKTIAICIKQEDKIKEQFAYIQYAMLYTNQEGVRLIRIINLSFKVDSEVGNIYRSADVDAVTSIILRKSIALASSSQIKQIQESIIETMVLILYSYRTNCAAQSAPGQLILPEALKIMPLYLQSAFKQDVLKSGAGVKLDDKAYDMFFYLTQSFYSIAQKLYPKLYPIHTILDIVGNQPGLQIGNNVILPSSIPLSVEKIHQDDNINVINVWEGIYIIDNGETIIIQVFQNAKEALIQNLFGVETFADISDYLQFPALENDYSQRVNAIIDQLRKNKRGAYQNVKIICSRNTAQEAQLYNSFIEDPIKGDTSYGDFLCMIHKQIQAKFI